MGVTAGSARLRGWWRSEILVLAYHRVLDLDADPEFDFDPDLVSASTADFAWQMRYLAENYNPIGFQRLVEALDGRAPLPPRPVIVTFDDGFDDNYRNAFPALKAAGVPAVFFVSTGYLGGTEPFWFDWTYRLCLEAARRGEPVRVGAREWRIGSRDPSNGFRQVMRALWQLPDRERRRAVERIERALGVTRPAEGFARSRPMTWEQVEEMAAAGMEFGSHAVSHPILTRLEADELNRELRESKAVLEARLRRPVLAVAYPVGQRFAYDHRVQAAARDAGYRFGVAYTSGTNRLPLADPYALERLHVEREVGRAEFAAALALPELFA